MTARVTHFEQIPISEVKKIVQMEQQKEYGMNGGHLTYPHWQQPLLDAILEFDPERLARKIEQTEMLVSARRCALRQQGGEPTEERALDDAMTSLRILKRDRCVKLDAR